MTVLAASSGAASLAREVASDWGFKVEETAAHRHLKALPSRRGPISHSSYRAPQTGGRLRKESALPHPGARQFFAFRTIHRPDGSSGPAGFSCVTLEQAVATPGVTVAQVFEAIRRVKLPGGEIGVKPEVRGLANLESYFWVEGTNQPPVELQVGGSTVRAEFRVVEYRWTFGGEEGLVTEGPGSPGLESEVRTTFGRRGFYRVGVTVMWVAEAYLDGRRVGEVDELVSRAQTTYPVAELRTVLTG
jgi:hypothetical protein